MKKPKSAKSLSTGTRVYYFDGYEDKKGHPYLAISEIPTDIKPGNKKRQRIFVHAQNLEPFIATLNEAAEEIRKASHLEEIKEQ